MTSTPEDEVPILQEAPERNESFGSDPPVLAPSDDAPASPKLDQVLRSDRSRVFVSSGIAANERVVSGALALAVDGMLVRVVDDGAAAPDSPNGTDSTEYEKGTDTLAAARNAAP